jgi:hypothetical protein
MAELPEPVVAELATRDGLPPPPGLPTGEFRCTGLDHGAIRIDHADPRILISTELLYEIVANPTPHAQLVHDLPGHPLLKIRGVNRTVIYRIVEWLPRICGAIGEWPD